MRQPKELYWMRLMDGIQAMERFIISIRPRLRANGFGRVRKSSKLVNIFSVGKGVEK